MKNAPIKALINAFRSVLTAYSFMDPGKSDPLHFLEDSTTAIPGFRVPYKPISLAYVQSSQHSQFVQVIFPLVGNMLALPL